MSVEAESRKPRWTGTVDLGDFGPVYREGRQPALTHATAVVGEVENELNRTFREGFARRHGELLQAEEVVGVGRPACLPLKIIAFITEHPTVCRILEHIRMPPQRPEPLAHSPPLQDELLYA